MIEHEAVTVTGLSAATGWAGAWLVSRYAAALKLVSVPNYRSSHSQPTPNGGGLGIVLGSSLAGGWYAWGKAGIWWVMAGAALLLALVSLVDDMHALPRRVRFAVQLIVVAVLLWVSGSVLPGQWMLFGVLVLAGVWWVNLFNFMDGIDGIAASQAICMLLAAALIGAWSHPGVITSVGWQWLLALVAANAGFLLVNWPPARVFMGDVGSIYLAFMIFGQALVSVREGWMSYLAWMILGAVFIADATMTLLRRMLTGQPWYEGHRSHAYQRLARRFGGHLPVTMLAITINVLWLTPLAWFSLASPEQAGTALVIAYAPLVTAVWLLGAGKPDGV